MGLKGIKLNEVSPRQRPYDLINTWNLKKNKQQQKQKTELTGTVKILAIAR